LAAPSGSEQVINSNDHDTSRGTRAASPGRFSWAMHNVIEETREAWPTLSHYKKFEQIVSWALTALISLVIIAALFHLSVRIVALLLYGLIDPADPENFQALFGMILTVLIALEFNHSIVGVLERHKSIIQVRTVVLIALLALVRKFIIFDVSKTDPLTIIGLAAAILALGSVYWVVRDQDRKDAPEES
jgi:uncharacterized membrane protein (DUF373 family)